MSDLTSKQGAVEFLRTTAAVIRGIEGYSYSANRCDEIADEIDRLTAELAEAREANRLALHTGLMQEAVIADLRNAQEATGLQPVRRWNAKYPGISMLEHNGELIRSGFGPYVLAEDYDRVASLLSEAVRMIEGYRRAGFITNPAALEQASDFALRAGNSHHE